MPQNLSLFPKQSQVIGSENPGIEEYFYELLGLISNFGNIGACDQLLDHVDISEVIMFVACDK